eukprot:scaffold101786_cov54-Phaeocystis_antarctica.AAC.2
MRSPSRIAASVPPVLPPTRAASPSQCGARVRALRVEHVEGVKVILRQAHHRVVLGESLHDRRLQPRARCRLRDAIPRVLAAARSRHPPAISHGVGAEAGVVWVPQPEHVTHLVCGGCFEVEALPAG